MKYLQNLILIEIIAVAGIANMSESDALSVVLGIMDGNWKSINAALSKDQRDYLLNQISVLEQKLRSSRNIGDTDEAARNFFKALYKIASLRFLTDLGTAKLRGGRLLEPDDEIKIKILNFCTVLRTRIDDTFDDEHKI